MTITSPSPPLTPNPNSAAPAKIFFASHTGTAKLLAGRLAALLAGENLPSSLVDPLHYEPEDLPSEPIVLIVSATGENGDPPRNAAFLARWLAESADDFRVGSSILSGCRFAVFGVGSKAYGSKFNAAARGFVRWMRKLGAVEMVGLGEGDVDGGEVGEEFNRWSQGVLGAMRKGIMEEFDGEEEDWEEFYEEEKEEEDFDVVDLEDVVGKAPGRGGKGEGVSGNGGIKEMVTPIVRRNLEKQVVMRLFMFFMILCVLSFNCCFSIDYLLVEGCYDIG